MSEYETIHVKPKGPVISKAEKAAELIDGYYWVECEDDEGKYWVCAGQAPSADDPPPLSGEELVEAIKFITGDKS